jgi:hypothetical protein
MDDVSRHQCLIYEGAASHQLDGLANIILERLGNNYRCLYLHSPNMVADMRDCLMSAGVNVPREVEKGSLILSSDQSHLQNGGFDPKTMLASLQSALLKSLADGYVGLWATGDMGWEFGHDKKMAKLLEYECALEEFVQKNPTFGGICQYHRDHLPNHAAQVAMQTHQAVHIEEQFMSVNPYYRSPRDLMMQSEDLSPDVVDILLIEMRAQKRP